MRFTRRIRSIVAYKVSSIKISEHDNLQLHSYHRSHLTGATAFESLFYPHDGPKEGEFVVCRDRCK
jgi:hypothetical protein